LDQTAITRTSKLIAEEMHNKAEQRQEEEKAKQAAKPKQLAPKRLPSNAAGRRNAGPSAGRAAK
jgi:hypothetical protein